MRFDLKGLMKWTARDEWRAILDEQVGLHLAALNEYDLDEDELLERIGQAAYDMIIECAFEDFLTADAEEGRNVIDDYLKRRGWKEGPSTRAYMAGLRDSVMSLYEVSTIVPGQSFLARDLIRGGEPVLVNEKSGSKMLNQWDRLAARLVTVQGKVQMTGAVLRFTHGAGDKLIAEIDDLVRAVRKDKKRLAADRDIEVPEEVLAEIMSLDTILRMSGFMFSAVWLRDTLDRTAPENAPRAVTPEGDPIEPVTLRYGFAKGTTQKAIHAALAEVPNLRRDGRNFWNWFENKHAKMRKPVPATAQVFKTTLDNGATVLGNIEIEGRYLYLSTLSRPRAERGSDLLTGALEGLIRPPEEVDHLPSEEDLFLDEGNALEQLSDEEQRVLLQQFLDDHYAAVLDEPIETLGNKSPRNAVRSEKGRVRVVAWLKYLENGSAIAAPGMEGYDFTWMWKELGLLDRRK
ncbi:MAG: hypothetical protein ACYC0C_08115 [Devosia sp.]